MSIYKGGYITIDCGGGDLLAEDGVTIPGVYNAIKETYGKVVILSNVNFSTANMKYVELPNLTVDNDDFASVLFLNGGMMITITSTDIIYAVAAE